MRTSISLSTPTVLFYFILIFEIFHTRIAFFPSLPLPLFLSPLLSSIPCGVTHLLFSPHSFSSPLVLHYLLLFSPHLYSQHLLYIISILFSAPLIHHLRNNTQPVRKLHLSPQLGIVELELDFQDGSKRTFYANPMQVTAPTELTK